MPVSEAEIKADRDRLRAEYAIRVHKLETELEQARLERARQLIEINRRDATISALETDLVGLKADLEENQNARRVLEQTVADRLPRVEARLAEAKRLLFNRDREIAELVAGARRQKQAMEEATSVNAQRAAEIERLTTALTTRGSRGRQTASAGQEGEVALRAEIEALRTKTRDQATLIDRLQRRLGQGYALPGPESDAARLRQNIAEAEATLAAGRASPDEESRPERIGFEREIRSLKAKVEDQAGEIARLRAALTTFEQSERAGGGLMDTKLALKARVGSAEAQVHQQAATISRLRAELASAHERLARQAALFRDEMRRIGAGTQPTSGRARRPTAGDRRGLVERVSQVRLNTVTAERALAATPQPERKPLQKSNGSDTQGEPQAPAKSEEKASAAESPKAAQIPEPGRKRRLLDRITGMAKG
jgi:chromosome segregation ATPase